MFEGKSILITGGSGIFGNSFVQTVLRDCPNVKRIIIFSRDTQKHQEMQQMFPHTQYPQLRFFLGDVRDIERLNRACEDVDFIIHAATLASISASEYNPEECIKTNIIGAENVINAAIDNDVKHVVALSSDKACAPLNLYGATQLVSDRLFVAANNMKGKRDIKFSVVRYGNVLGSKGSVVHTFLQRASVGGRYLPITDFRMTRFLITIQQVVAAVEYTLSNHLGGEIIVPKVSSYRITDLATAIAPSMEQREIGIRAGEKLHEELISPAESLNAIETKDYYIIMPSLAYTAKRHSQDYIEHYKANRVEDGFHYSSHDNQVKETVETLQYKIRQYFSSTL